MSDLVERLSALEEKTQQQKVCAMAKLIASLDNESAAVLNRLMANESISTRSIHLELSASGFRLDRQSVALHRSQRCICDHSLLGDD